MTTPSSSVLHDARSGNVKHAVMGWGRRCHWTGLPRGRAPKEGRAWAKREDSGCEPEADGMRVNETAAGRSGWAERPGPQESGVFCKKVEGAEEVHRVKEATTHQLAAGSVSAENSNHPHLRIPQGRGLLGARKPREAWAGSARWGLWWSQVLEPGSVPSPPSHADHQRAPQPEKSPCTLESWGDTGGVPTQGTEPGAGVAVTSLTTSTGP